MPLFRSNIFSEIETMAIKIKNDNNKKSLFFIATKNP